LAGFEARWGGQECVRAHRSGNDNGGSVVPPGGRVRKEGMRDAAASRGVLRASRTDQWGRGRVPPPRRARAAALPCGQSAID
jgi:hypothetical protein